MQDENKHEEEERKEPPGLEDSDDENEEGVQGKEKNKHKQHPRSAEWFPRARTEEMKPFWLRKAQETDERTEEEACRKTDGRTKEEEGRTKKLSRNQRRGQGKDQEKGQKKKTKTLMQEMQEEVRRQEIRARCSGTLNPIVTIEPEGVNAVQGNGGWEVITCYIDSGATENVIGEEMLLSVATVDGPQKRRGVVYEVANGVRIPNLGEKTFAGMTVGGAIRCYTAQVCEVNKALLSVSKITAAGNTVVSGGPNNSYIMDNITKEKIWMHEANGMYAIDVWVKADGKVESLKDVQAEDF